MKANKLVFSPWFEQQGLIINYLDIGARGDISEPWSLFAPASINVIGFEPDPTEYAHLLKAYPQRSYYPSAVWGEKAVRPFYLCEWESTSSMYPPAEESNRAYKSDHWAGRVPVKTFQVECVPLDKILFSCDTPNFIKIDTQGAELEILRGGEKILRQAAPLVLAETWCAEVYTGAPLTHEVMDFMYKLGYQVFDLNVAAAWQHSNSSVPDVYCKAKTIGFDLLFVKRLDSLSFNSEDDLLKFAGLCELFGFRDYSLAALSASPFRSQRVSKSIEILAQNNHQDKYESRLWRRIQRRLLGKRNRLWPDLH